VGELFGTDGVRGVANTELSAYVALKLGAASAYVLRRKHEGARILVGRASLSSGPGSASRSESPGRFCAFTKSGSADSRTGPRRGRAHPGLDGPSERAATRAASTRGAPLPAPPAATQPSTLRSVPAGVTAARRRAPASDRGALQSAGESVALIWKKWLAPRSTRLNCLHQAAQG